MLASLVCTKTTGMPGEGYFACAHRLLRDTADRREFWEAECERVSDAFGRGVALGYDGQGRAPVLGREVLLREALANLVHNAVAYGGRGGTVTVSVARRAPAQVVLSVEDDGPGIPPEERDRVLERFYRRPGARGGGAGLGLPIVAQIAEGHGATLHLLDGAGGKGLRVEIRFPAAPPS